MSFLKWKTRTGFVCYALTMHINQSNVCCKCVSESVKCTYGKKQYKIQFYCILCWANVFRTVDMHKMSKWIEVAHIAKSILNESGCCLRYSQFSIKSHSKHDFSTSAISYVPMEKAFSVSISHLRAGNGRE